MGSRYHLLTWLLFSCILVSGQLQIPLEQEETYEHLEENIAALFGVIEAINSYRQLRSFVTFTGTFDLRPSLEQRLMEHFSVPINLVGSKKEPLDRYPAAENVVIVLFSGLDDPSLAALNDLALSDLFISFLYIPPRNVNKFLTMEEMREFFSWCWDRRFIRSLLFFRGESEVEAWWFFYFDNINMVKLEETSSVTSIVRENGYRFNVHIANDIPMIFWYNSSVQADVIGGGNISLSGPIGILMVEFMRYINASMDIIPISTSQSSNYEIFEVSSDRRVDMVANLATNDSYLYSPVMADTQICLVVPLRRLIPFNRYVDKIFAPSYYLGILLFILGVFGVKYMVHRRRSVVDTFFTSLRFGLGIPLPGGQLNRLPLADKIMEVYSFLFVGILIGASTSILSTFLTTGVYYPPIRDVESMRASGLRILTEDPTVKQAFEENIMPSSLADLVDISDEWTVSQKYLDLNESYVYVTGTPNWNEYQLYQQRMNKKPFALSGPELCSKPLQLRLPISPYSPLRFIFPDYYYRIFESGLQQKWQLMGFQKFRELRGIFKLPVDEATNWKPLNLDFFSVFIKVYIGGMSLSILVFVLELLYKRYVN